MHCLATTDHAPERVKLEVEVAGEPAGLASYKTNMKVAVVAIAKAKKRSKLCSKLSHDLTDRS